MSENRKKLEQAALDSVQQSGFNALSFRTLAQEIGIKSSSVHYHFPEKSDLAASLIENYSKAFFEKLDQIDSTRWGMRRKVSAFIEIFEAVSDQDKLCLCGMMASEVDALDAKSKRLLDDFFETTEQWLAALFDNHREQINTDLNSGLLASALLSGLEGALLLDRTVSDKQRVKAQKQIFLQLLTA